MSFLINRNVDLKSQHNWNHRNTVYVHLECTDDPSETADPPEPLSDSPQPWGHSEHERNQTEFYGH